MSIDSGIKNGTRTGIGNGDSHTEGEVCSFGYPFMLIPPPHTPPPRLPTEYQPKERLRGCGYPHFGEYAEVYRKSAIAGFTEFPTLPFV